MDIFQLFGTILVDNQEAIDALTETADEAKKTGESAKKIGDGFKKNGEITTKKLADIAKTANKTTDEVKSEAEKLARSYRDAGMDSASAMKQAYADIEAGAKKASEGSKESGSNITAAFKKVTKAGAAVVSAIVAIGTAMVALAENTREYRSDMGKLDAAFTAAGHSAEVATDTYNTLYGVIGETDQTVEAAQQIALLADSAEDAAKWADLAAGVVGRFSDAMQPETFFEAANETYSLNEATGAYVQMLEGCQMSVEEFNAGLQACTTAAEKQAYMLGVTQQALGKAGETYKKNNKEIIAATSAQDKLTAATSRWGAAVEPIVTVFKEGLAVAINFAADAMEYMLNPSMAVGEALAGTAKTSEEAAKKVAELKAQLEEYADIPAYLWNDDFQNQYTALSYALESAETQYYDLVAAEQAAAGGATDAVESTAEAVDEFSEITDEYVSDAQAFLEKFAATYESIYSKVANWFKPFEEASVSVQTNINDMMAAMQSQVDFNTSYAASLQTLGEYGLGSLAEAFQSYGAKGSAYAQTIVDAVEQAGGAATAEGQAIIQGFADINQQVADSQSELSMTMTEMSANWDEALGDMIGAYRDSIDSLDKSGEASAAAVETFGAFLQGMNDKIPEIEAQMSTFGSRITSALQSGIGSIMIPIAVQGIPGHKTGLDYVPYDNYLAYLHKGEMVVPAEEAATLRNLNQDMGSAGNESSPVNDIGTAPMGRTADQNDSITGLLAAMLDINQEMLQALTAGQTFKVGEREFARLVKKYA